VYCRLTKWNSRISLHSHRARGLVLLAYRERRCRWYRIIRAVDYVSLTMEHLFVYLSDELASRISGRKLLLLAAHHLHKFVVSVSETADLVPCFHGAIVVETFDWSIH